VSPNVRPSWIEIDSGALSQNVQAVRGIIGGAVRFFAVVKGDGYGCGAAEVAKVVLESGADALAAADPNDIASIRKAGITAPILLYPCSLPESAAATVELDTIVTVHDFESLAAFAGLGHRVRAFVKIDTGMNRLGFTRRDWQRALDLCRSSSSLDVVGLATHFPTPTDPEQLDDVRESADLFRAAGVAAEDAGLGNVLMMAASSPFVGSFPGTHFSAVDPGRILYDLIGAEWRGGINIRPVFRAVKSAVIHLKDVESARQIGYAELDNRTPRRVAVLPIGFTDGMPSTHSGHVLIDGRRARVLSQLSMEHTVVDVTDIPGAVVGSEAVILGRQGDDEIGPTELAAACGLTEFELLIRLGNSLHRVYVT
jgi:alanine racemase